MKKNNNAPEVQNVENAIFEEMPDIFADLTSTETLKETVSMETLYERASIATRALSGALMGDSVAAIAKERENVKSAVDAYNKAYFDALYRSYLDKDNPCREVVKDCYCRVLRCIESNSDDGAKVELDYATKIIDLRAVDAAAKTRVITNIGSWTAYAEKLALVFAMRATADIGGNTDEMQRLYKMSEQARGLDIGVNLRKANPISNNSLVTATQEAVNAILFIDDGNGHNTLHITTKDVSFLLYTMFRRGKKELTVSMPRTATVISALTEVMYKLINGKFYSAEYDKIETREA